jgi:glutamate-ammonia-ligase adenylyltransferase
VQLLQARHGGSLGELQTPGTVAALASARAAGVIDASDADRLAEAYSFLMSLRNRLFLMAGRPTDVLPARPEDLEALGIAMGYSEQPRQEIEEDYLRVTRRARKVAEPLIYG